MTRNIINEKIVMQAFIDELDAGRVAFLKDLPAQSEQIRTLLTQMIAAERINERIQIAVTLWKALFAPAMSFIDSDRQGYDAIFSYFDAYVEFEELIFASDSFYRDHTLHCLWVYFLGEYIVRRPDYAQLFETKHNQASLLELMPKAFEQLGFNNTAQLLYKNLSLSVKLQTDLLHYEDASRCIMALTHDLGYPLKKIEKINKSIKSVMPYFSLSSFADFSFKYDDVQQHFIESFLNMLALDTDFSFRTDEETMPLINKLFKLDGRNILDIENDLETVFTPEELEILKNGLSMHLSIRRNNARAMAASNDFEDYKHGIMSAYLLARNLAAFKNIDYKCGDDMAGRDLLGGDVYTKLTILNSITSHTMESYKISIIDIDSLLTFVDELEEFSRISRASQNREYVEEFCSTGLYMEDGVLNIDFIFDNERLDNLDPERSFKGRCKRFLTLFNIRELDTNLKLIVRCIGKLERDSRTYELELWRKHAVIRIDGVEQNIPKYLKSTQFYTSEGYANL